MRTKQAAYINAGSLSDVFSLMDYGHGNEQGKVILKGFKLRKRSRELSPSHWTRTLKDAMISAAVGHHPLVVSNYGYCGLFALGEYVPYGTAETLTCTNDPFCENGQKPMNLKTAHRRPLVEASNLNVTQKLQFSLNMAEALALLHNHKDGVLVHGDVWMAQFLLDETGSRVRINDFNNGRILQFNAHRQEYCPISLSFGEDYGSAPEETSGVTSGEERDIYRLGDNMYYLLTGYDLFPNVCGSGKKYEMLEGGETSFLDPRWEERSLEEGALARLIRQCWELKPEDRPSIGELVLRLRAILKRHLESK